VTEPANGTLSVTNDIDLPVTHVLTCPGVATNATATVQWLPPVVEQASNSAPAVGTTITVTWTSYGYLLTDPLSTCTYFDNQGTGVPNLPVTNNVGVVSPPLQSGLYKAELSCSDTSGHSHTEALSALETTHDLLLVEHLVRQGVLEFTTGAEIGKLSYGTGDIPLVRTSDISNWEVKIDPKHGVSEEILAKYRSKMDVREGGILIVVEGTYLIGTCAYISRCDEKILYQSHIVKIRTLKPDVLSPFLLLAALSSRPVIAQIQAKRFTQDIIDTLGNRVYELVLPIPKDAEKRKAIEGMVSRSISDRTGVWELAKSARELIVR
jgi:hypothetical protein